MKTMRFTLILFVTFDLRSLIISLVSSNFSINGLSLVIKIVLPMRYIYIYKATETRVPIG